MRAMSLGDAAAIAPVEYTRIVFALLVGLLLFREVPDAWAMLGAAVVIAATLTITLREARLRRPAAPTPE